jgi:hypothetical protein
MLPAGLEALDTSLKTTSAAASDPELQRSESTHAFWWHIHHAEVHDNRVVLFARSLSSGTYDYTYLARATTPGIFNVLPPRAYQMYRPEVFGQGSGTRFLVIE